MIFFFLLITLLFFQTGCSYLENSTESDSTGVEPVWFDFTIVNTYPHDPEAFTQGLLFKDGYLYESTGRRGYSSLRKVDLDSGEILRLHELDPEYFGEGLSVMGDRLIQLTLSAGTGFIYDIETFALEAEFEYEGEGWGLTNDGERLIMSDGSAELRIIDPDTFQKTDRLIVREGGEPLENINEMEMVGDKLFANVLHTNHIAIIDPDTGIVEGRIDLSELLPIVRQKSESINVLNGIAYDHDEDRLFVTGKLWPKLFEIRIFPREQSTTDQDRYPGFN